MKKLFILFTALFLFVSNVNAEAVDYSIKDLNMKLTFGEEWLVVTTDNYKNNDELTELGITEEYMKNFFDSNSAYLDSIYEGVELTVRAKDTTTKGALGDYKEKQIESFAKELIKKTGADSYELVDINDVKYVKSTYVDNSLESPYYILEFNTFYNGKTVTVTAQKTSQFTSTEKEEITNVVNKIVISNIEHYTPKSIFSNLLVDALVGAVIGGIAAIVIKVINKNKKEKTEKKQSKK